MFQEGSLIIYGTTGVCRVTGITMRDDFGQGQKQPYYTLCPLYQSGSIFAPVDNSRVFMRPILTKEEADALIDSIPTIHAEAFHSRSPQELAEHYTQALRAHNCLTLLETVLSIHAKKQNLASQHKKFGQVDSRFLKQAQDLLHGELAAALGIEKDAVQTYIAARLGQDKTE